MSIVYAVSNANQYRDAELVRSAGLDVHVLDVNTASWLENGQALESPHVKDASRRTAVLLARRLTYARKSAECLIVGQDVGPLERFLVRLARHLRLRVGLLPDGLAFEPMESAGNVARSRLGRAGVKLGLTYGAANYLGNTRPDFVLSWGPGWESHWRSMGIPEVVHVGSPRSSDLMNAIGPSSDQGNVLVASQPLATLGLPDHEIREWYRFLDTALQLGWRLRPHPWETQGDYASLVPKLPPWQKRSFLEDMSWADVVVSPFSTLLLEGAAVGKGVVSVVTGSGMASLRSASPALRHPGLPSVRGTPLLDGIQSLAFRTSEQALGWANQFLMEPRAAPRRAAEAVVSLLGE